MNFLNSQDDLLKDPKAVGIYEEILKSLSEYTNDSNYAKFFLPETIIVNCRSVAGALSSSVYNPPVNPKKIYTSKIYSYFLLAVICGVQIFLKQHSKEKNGAPYRVKENKKDIEKAQDNALYFLTVKPSNPNFVDEIIIKFLTRLSIVLDREDLVIRGKKIMNNMLNVNLSSAIFFGYYFAKEMISEK